MNTIKIFREKCQLLEHIKDNQSKFTENLLAAFGKDHPEFIEQLKERGLNEEEIRYCCLEVLGLREKTPRV